MNMAVSGTEAAQAGINTPLAAYAGELSCKYSCAELTRYSSNRHLAMVWRNFHPYRPIFSSLVLAQPI